MVVGTYAVEVNVAYEVALRRHSLEPHGGLLLPDANLAHHVEHDTSATRLLAVATIRPNRPVELPVALLVHALARDAPRGEDCVGKSMGLQTATKGSRGIGTQAYNGRTCVAVPRHVILGDGGIAVVRGKEDCIAIQTNHGVALDDASLGTLQENGARALQAPAAAANSIQLKVRGVATGQGNKALCRGVPCPNWARSARRGASNVTHSPPDGMPCGSRYVMRVSRMVSPRIVTSVTGSAMVPVMLNSTRVLVATQSAVSGMPVVLKK